MELLSLSFLSQGILLEELLHLDPFFFLHILWILREMKVSSSLSESSSNSSSDESLTLSALEELLRTCSLVNGSFLFFRLLRAKEFFLLRPLSYRALVHDL
ncbi:hypothetical protein AAZX31_04G145800 [Glycine max]